MATYTRDQLLPYIRKYFGTGEEDKWLYLINGESGYRDDAVGDGGAAYGLFQSQHNPGQTLDSQFADAKRLYDADKRNGGTGFGDWGEGRLFQGKPFGALGNNPYGGTVTQPSQSDSYRDRLLEQETTYAQRLDELLNTPRPSDFAAGNNYDDQIATYGELLAKVRTAIAQVRQSPDTAQTAFDNDIASRNQDITLRGQDINIAQQGINRQQQGQAEAGRRASLVQDATDQLIKYGLPEGRTSFSNEELGGAFETFGKITGRDPKAQNKVALGQVAIDPYGDLARFDSALGVDGPTVGAYGGGSSVAPRPTYTAVTGPASGTAPLPTGPYGGDLSEYAPLPAGGPAAYGGTASEYAPLSAPPPIDPTAYQLPDSTQWGNLTPPSPSPMADPYARTAGMKPVGSVNPPTPWYPDFAGIARTIRERQAAKARR